MKPFEAKRVGKPAAPATNAGRADLDGAFVPAETWLEYLEEEMEARCSAEEKEDLDLVLKNSPEDLAVRESLVRVRAAVKSLDDVALPESGHYYDNLHSKIMAAIDDEIVMNGEPVRKAKTKKRAFVFKRSVFSQSMFGAMGMTMMIAVLAFIGLNRPASNTPMASSEKQTLEENFERKIAMVDSHSGAVFAHEMGSFESEEDFLTESAARRLKQLSSAQADALIRSLQR